MLQSTAGLRGLDDESPMGNVARYHEIGLLQLAPGAEQPLDERR